jgi:hypothetical protein
MRHRIAASILAMAACLATPAVLQAQAGRVPTVTRLVKIFAERETTLADRARSTDSAALDLLLDPSFEMRVASAPGAPVPRDEWIREMRASPHGTARIEQMAVHDFGDVAVVSFRQADEPAAGGGAPPSVRFIVDCWKRSGDDWKLAVRYSSAAPATVRRPAGTTIDKRY